MPFLVFHDAYQYLEQRYHLNIKGVVQVNPHVPDSAKSRWDTQQQFKHQGISHVFIEPQLNGKWLYQIPNLTVDTLDPLGATLPLEQRHYVGFLSHLINVLSRSLGQSLERLDGH